MTSRGKTPAGRVDGRGGDVRGEADSVSIQVDSRAFTDRGRLGSNTRHIRSQQPLGGRGLSFSTTALKMGKREGQCLWYEFCAVVKRNEDDFCKFHCGMMSRMYYYVGESAE